MTWQGNKYSPEFYKLRKVVKKRDQGLCVRCNYQGVIRAGHEVDHYINVAQGGTDTLNNLWLLCKHCHQTKTIRESRGLSGFKPVRGFDGYLIEEPDWQEVIRKRNNSK